MNFQGKIVFTQNWCNITLKISEEQRKYLRFFLEREGYGILIPPFRDSNNPTNFYQVNESSHRFAQTSGYSVDNIPRRQFNNESVTAGHPVRSINCFVNIRGVRISDKQEKSIIEPSHTMEFLGYTMDSTLLTLSPTGKGEQNKRQWQAHVGTKESLGKRHGSVDRPINSNESSRSSWPISYRSLPILKTKALYWGVSLRPSDSPNKRSAHITSVVDYQPRFLERECLIAPRPSFNNSIRCWGANCQHTKIVGGGVMARRGEISPYKPVRTKSSYVCYAFPPFCLISSYLAKIREERAQIVLVTPIWQAQAWYPLLLQMSIDDPVLIPMSYNTPVSIERDTPPNSKPNVEISRVKGLGRSFTTIGISEE